MRPRPARGLALLVGVTLLLAACDRGDDLDVDTAEIIAGEVVQTVAAAAELEPAARVSVTAPAGGEIVALHVADGDEVVAGEELVRLRSDTVDLQIAQAEAALDAADAMAGAAGAAGADLSPMLAAVRGQFEAVLPPLLDGLEQQAAVLPDDDLRAEAEERIAGARASYESSLAELRAAERDARGQAERATAGQRRAAEAQREQARLALEAAERRGDELTLVAPADGVVELGRADDAGGSPLDDLDALEGAEGLDGLDALAGEVGGDRAAGPLAEGVSVASGQRLVTVYDLSGFTARVEVDEIDVVEVEPGQRATVLVDAYPDVELSGHVSFVALSPSDGAAGGATFPVTVELTGVPDEVGLRVGMTASTEIVVREVEGEAVVPTSALLRLGRDDLVRAVRDGVVHDVPVEVLAVGEQDAAVDGELEVGERVVTTGVDQLADGDELP